MSEAATLSTVPQPTAAPFNFFLSVSFTLSLFVVSQWLDSNNGSPVSEAATLPTVPQPTAAPFFFLSVSFTLSLSRRFSSSIPY